MPGAERGGRAADDVAGRHRGGRRGDPVLGVHGPRPVRAARLLHRDDAPAGRRGDFLTSPEVGPLFGAVIARATSTRVWDRLDRPDPFTVVDAGAGPGTLARAVLAAAPGVRGGAALRGRRGVRRPAGPPPRRRRVAARPAGRADRRRRAGQRAARQPAVPAGRPRRGVARGVRDDGAGRLVRRGAVGAVRPACRTCCPPDRPTGRGHRCRTPPPTWVLDGPGASCGAGRSWSSTTPGRRTAELAALPWRSWLRTYRGHERGGRTPSPTRATRTSPSTSRSTSSPEPDAVRTQVAVPAAPRHRRAGRRGPRGVGRGGRRGPTSRRWRCAAGSPRPRRCSTRPGSAASPSWSGGEWSESRASERSARMPDRLTAAR